MHTYAKNTYTYAKETPIHTQKDDGKKPVYMIFEGLKKIDTLIKKDLHDI